MGEANGGFGHLGNVGCFRGPARLYPYRLERIYGHFMTVLVTGAAGFIGFHLVNALLDRGERVVGVDNFIHFYDPALKQARVQALLKRDDFSFHDLDVGSPKALAALFEGYSSIDRVLHMAGQPGVRQSITHPWE